MSRKGKIPVSLPKGVEAKITSGVITVKGPKGSLEQEIPAGINVVVENGSVIVTVEDDDRRPFQGLCRTLIDNMVIGTSQGFEKRLKMIGTGYRAAVQGNLLDLQVGLSHEKKLPIPASLTIKVEKNTTIIIAGYDKQLVGQFAASIRAVRPPEPYKGKGIRYEGEFVRKKAGKSAAGGKK